MVEVVDRTGDDPRTGLFSERLATAAHAELERPDGRVICILNRTGRIRVLACRACGELARCTRCGGALAQAEAEGLLGCGRCGETRPAVCAVCDSAKLKSLRIGVSRATEELAALLGKPAVELTAESVRSEEIERAPLVVGTEAALHRVDHAGLVVFLDFDQHLLAPRFGAGEEALALLARAARVVGTRSGGGRVLVQTRIPGHEALAAAAHADPGLLTAAELPVRRQLGLPPTPRGFGRSWASRCRASMPTGSWSGPTIPPAWPTGWLRWPGHLVACAWRSTRRTPEPTGAWSGWSRWPPSRWAAGPVAVRTMGRRARCVP